MSSKSSYDAMFLIPRSLYYSLMDKADNMTKEHVNDINGSQLDTIDMKEGVKPSNEKVNEISSDIIIEEKELGNDDIAIPPEKKETEIPSPISASTEREIDPLSEQSNTGISTSAETQTTTSYSDASTQTDPITVKDVNLNILPDKSLEKEKPSTFIPKPFKWIWNQDTRMGESILDDINNIPNFKHYNEHFTPQNYEALKSLAGKAVKRRSSPVTSPYLAKPKSREEKISEARKAELRAELITSKDEVFPKSAFPTTNQRLAIAARNSKPVHTYVPPPSPSISTPPKKTPCNKIKENSSSSTIPKKRKRLEDIVDQVLAKNKQPSKKVISSAKKK